ncbi:MAG: hypothetical protein ACI4RD_08340 [Kiritimatiellia bacterium]
MKKDRKMKCRIQRAKRSALGRVLCRLAGDAAGAVMMEYIVLAVLLVAATVGIVVLFGRYMRAEWYTAMLAMMGKTDSAAANQETMQGNVKQNAETVNNQGNTIDGGSNSGTQHTMAE